MCATYSGNVVSGLRRSGNASAGFKRRKLAWQVRVADVLRQEGLQGEAKKTKRGVDYGERVTPLDYRKPHTARTHTHTQTQGDRSCP